MCVGKIEREREKQRSIEKHEEHKKSEKTIKVRSKENQNAFEEKTFVISVS